MRNRSREISVALIMLLLAVLLVLAFLWALSIGTVKLSFMQIYEGIVNQLPADFQSKLQVRDLCMISSGSCVCLVWCWLPW